MARDIDLGLEGVASRFLNEISGLHLSLRRSEGENLKLNMAISQIADALGVAEDAKINVAAVIDRARELRSLLGGQ